MKKLLKPQWIFFVHTLSFCLFALLYVLKYKALQQYLSEDEIALWYKLGTGLLLLILGNTAYAIWRLVRKENIDLIYTAVNMIYSIAFLYIYYLYTDSLWSWNIPSWLRADAEDLNTYAGGFFMPSLLYSLLCAAILLTKKPDEKKLWTQLLYAIMVPAFFYLLGVLLVPLWSALYFGHEHIFILLLVLGVCLFLFFIFRLCYVYYERKSFHSRYGLWIKIPVGIVFPLAGLALNSVIGLFGNYDSPWFYILTIVNGILITLPAPQKLSDRFVLYIFRCITFAFTFYFFIVFLPFTPLSVALIPLFGLGLLLVTPIILFVIHGTTLADDYKQLKTAFHPFILLGTGIAALLVLPVALTISMYNDKRILHSSLEYVYSPDYTKEYKLKPASIQKTLEIAGSTRKRDAIYSSTPYISSWYRYIVLDNMTLSYAKRKLLSGIFAGEDWHRSSTFESNRTQKRERYPDYKRGTFQ